MLLCQNNFQHQALFCLYVLCRVPLAKDKFEGMLLTLLVPCLVCLFCLAAQCHATPKGKDKDRRGACSTLFTRSPNAPHPIGRKPVFFLHIPKCGTSFEISIAEYACPLLAEMSNPIKEKDLVRSQKNKIVKDLCPGKFSRFRNGHEPLTLKARRGQAGHVVLMLRPPLTRIVSGYLHNFHDCIGMQEKYGVMENGPRRDAAMDKDSVILEYAKCVRGCAARMLTGEHCGLTPGRRRKSKTGEKRQALMALKILDRAAFVGMTDYWEESVCLFEAMYGGNFTGSTLTNVRPSPQAGRNWTDVLVNHGFEDWADEALYVRSKEKFKKLKSVYFV
ncbi:unnamed protein product [Choristocarpus tenellus]